MALPMIKYAKNIFLKTTAINHLCQLSLNILLYGDPNLNDNDNKQIFLSVQKYILNTKRFQANR